jgi:peptidoglycan/LPS O-acetylase OafA/YrhL
MALDYAGIVSVVFPLLVVALSTTDRGPARWLASGPMTYGGRISYCLYLVHFVVLDVTVTLWWQSPADRQIVTPGLALAVPGIVLLSLLLAAALHHGVEEPGRRAVLRLAAALGDLVRGTAARRRSGRTVPAAPGRLAGVPVDAPRAHERPDLLRVLAEQRMSGGSERRVPATIGAPARLETTSRTA